MTKIEILVKRPDMEVIADACESFPLVHGQTLEGATISQRTGLESIMTVNLTPKGDIWAIISTRDLISIKSGEKELEFDLFDNGYDLIFDRINGDQPVELTYRNILDSEGRDSVRMTPRFDL